MCAEFTNSGVIDSTVICEKEIVLAPIYTDVTNPSEQIQKFRLFSINSIFEHCIFAVFETDEHIILLHPIHLYRKKISDVENYEILTDGENR